MIDFSTGYSYEDILQEMLDKVPDSLDKREGSLIQTALGAPAWYLEGLFLTLASMQAAASVMTASGQDLDYLVANRGITRKPATPAIRKGTFNIGLTWDTLFKTVNGSSSVGFTSGELISAEPNVWVFEMTCVEPGVIGNSYTGQIIPAFSGVPDLEYAVLGDIITPGTEAESDESLRARYFATFEASPYGGNFSSYRQAVMKIPGVGAVQIYPANAYQGGGTVLVSVIDDTFSPASPALVQTVQNIICPGQSVNGKGIAPVGAAVTVTTATGVAINVDITVVFDPTVTDGVTLYGDAIKTAVGDYIESAAKAWGTPKETVSVEYPVALYVSRMIYAVLEAVPEVVSVSNVTINGSSSDLHLTENSTVQQLPITGVITVNE